MSVVNPSGRAQVNDNGYQLQIAIPTKKNWFILLFLPFWLIGWAVGEVTVPMELMVGKPGTPYAFLLAWLAMWTVGGACALLAFLWQAAGKHEILLSSGILTIKNGIFGFGLSKNYELSLVKNLKVNESKESSIFSYSGSMAFWGLPKGKIKFDYGMKTVQIAPFIDEPEARCLIDIFYNHGLKAIDI